MSGRLAHDYSRCHFGSNSDDEGRSRTSSLSLQCLTPRKTFLATLTTVKALNDVVRAGMARYICGRGSSRRRCTSPRCMVARFVSMQVHLNLIYREEEREMLPLCRARLEPPDRRGFLFRYHVSYHSDACTGACRPSSKT